VSRVPSDSDSYQAIADPTRRTMLDRLRHGPLTASELTAGFALTQPALSKHLRVLREAGLVEVEVRGRFRLYRQRPEALREVADWLSGHEQFWGEGLGALGEHLRRKRVSKP
jgi:DNA-binding transcriptional ArsR family regulator